jgi:hypothetical protein
VEESNLPEKGLFDELHVTPELTTILECVAALNRLCIQIDKASNRNDPEVIILRGKLEEDVKRANELLSVMVEREQVLRKGL